MQQPDPEQQENHHRLALSACQLDTECCTANCLLFRKEDNFCMTFLIGHWLADIQIICQKAHNFSRK